jgi:predicted nucleotide-binding protein
MADQTAPPEPGALAALADALERGHRVAAAPDLAPGRVRMWTGSVRMALRKVFGAESRVFAAWPTADTPVPADKVRETLMARMGNLERLLGTVTASAEAAMAPARGRRVFIGHGRSPVWRELKDFLNDRLSLPWDEFNRESAAGVATTERLTQMLDAASFAFLVMTAEDEHADSTLHARENVVHEVGLFQGKLGMRRAIVLLEQGCQVFSNIHGLTYISFPRGHIAACFEEIRRVLEREGAVAA